MGEHFEHIKKGDPGGWAKNLALHACRPCGIPARKVSARNGLTFYRQASPYFCRMCGEWCGEREKRLQNFFCNRFNLLARQEGFEPPTYRFVACCSIQLGYWRGCCEGALYLQAPQSSRDFPFFFKILSLPAPFRIYALWK